jgi:hypothetical protein
VNQDTTHPRRTLKWRPDEHRAARPGGIDQMNGIAWLDSMLRGLRNQPFGGRQLPGGILAAFIRPFIAAFVIDLGAS